ncbi:MAG: hypothetical protein ACTHOL_18120 [Luteibacter jiangsuensis]
MNPIVKALYPLLRFISRTVMVSFCLVPISAIAQDSERGLRNYQAIVNGQKRLDSLSPEEQREVIFVYRAMKDAHDGTNTTECQSAREGARAAASESLGYAKRYMQCLANADLTEDCSSEFRREKNAQEDYENAVLSVQGECR